MAGSGTPPPPGQAPGGGNWGGPPPAGGPGGMTAGGFQLKPVEAGPAPGIAYADLGMRLGAYIIDAVILFLGYIILGVIVSAILFTSVLTVGFGFAFIVVVILAVVFLAASGGYFIYTWTTMRASPGQRMLGLETVNADNGATLTQQQAIRRWAFLFGPSAIAVVLQYGAGWFVYSFGAMGLISLLISLASLAYVLYLLYTVTQSGKRQGFHDVQAGTVVVRRVA